MLLAFFRQRRDAECPSLNWAFNSEHFLENTSKLVTPLRHDLLCVHTAVFQGHIEKSVKRLTQIHLN